MFRMEAIKCLRGHTQCSGRAVCFYEQNQSAWHLIVKPNVIEEVKNAGLFSLSPNLSSKASVYTPNVILCTGCGSKVGMETLVGPQKEAYLCFNATALSGLPYIGGKKTWKKLKPLMPGVEILTCDDIAQLPRDSGRLMVPFSEPKEVDLARLQLSDLTCTKPRRYQVELFVRAALEDSIICLATGAGKTLVAVMVMKLMKRVNEGKTAIFLADRIPLVHQQAKVLREEGGLTVKVITGENYHTIDNLDDIFLQHNVVALTAQCFLNILNLNGFQIAQCSILVFDEAHHAQGHHAFSKIMQKFGACPREVRPRILGLTASPGSDSSPFKTAKRIDELCVTFGDCHVITPVLFEDEMREILFQPNTEYSAFKYTAAEISLQQDLWRHFLLVWNQMRDKFSEETVRDILNKPVKHITSTFRSLLRSLLQTAIEEERENAKQMVDYLWRILRMIDESDVHGVAAIKGHLSNLVRNGGEQIALTLFGHTPDFLTITDNDRRSGDLSSRMVSLLTVVRSVISRNKFSRILVFVTTRDKARQVVSVLEKIPDIMTLRPSRLVGHSGFDGMTWEQEQKPMLDRFRNGIVKLLVSTSVLEEGLDVPACNAVVRFDGMSSMIGTVQSRGRARHRDSQFVVLLSDDEHKKVWEVRLQEQNMLAHVKRSQQSFPDSLKLIVRQLTETNQVSEEGSAVLDENATFCGQAGAEAEWCLENSFVIKMNFHSKSWSESLLLATLSDFGQVWKCDVKLSLLYLCATKGQDAATSYKTICQEAIPCLRRQNGDCHLWLQKCIPDSSADLSESLSDSCTLDLQIISLGYLKDPSTFLEVHIPNVFNLGDLRANLEHKSSLTLTQGEEALSISACGIITLEFPLAVIYEWVVCHHDVDCQKQRLYIPLRQAPRVYVCNREKVHRVIAAGDQGPVTHFTHLLGKCFVFELVFTLADDDQQKVFAQLIDCLRRHGVLIYDTVISRLVDRENFDPIAKLPPELSFSTIYFMECIFSQRGLLFPPPLAANEFYRTLSSHSQSTQGRALQVMTQHISWFCNPLLLLKQALEDVVPLERLDVFVVPTNHTLVRSVTVTPLRVICFEPLAMKCSRMLRRFSSDQFLKVSFREENMDFLYGTDQDLLERVRKLLRCGLVVGGRKFMFLGSSSSMLRSHSCWMTCLEPSAVRTWLGDFNTISPRCVGTYMARVGLGMASSDVTITMGKEVVEKPVKDITTGEYCFSDGVGKISQKCLSEVGQCLQPNNTDFTNKTTAVQVRVAGYKGVLVLDPRLAPENKQCVLRKSMFKFKCPHLELEILSVASAYPLFLNRQGIVLLSSLGVRNSAFEGLQERELENLLGIFTKPEAQQDVFRYCGDLNLRAVCQEGLPIHTEPFLQLLLAAVYYQKVKFLVEKTHIFVPDGRLLMGVMDETFSLNYGEIFLQISDSSTKWEKKTIQGPCVTYKNPCFHPGDVRRLQARDVPSLRHLVNCVVFPAQGGRPHPNEMSGSDLDGDLYTVIWMSDLVPLETKEPMVFDTGSVEEVLEVKEIDMIDFFIRTISNVQLGRIANSHLALADSRPTGALDRDCVELAKLHATAVDFPKTGLQVRIPKRLVPENYPDFMRKLSKPSYPSKKVIGKLYRRASSLFGNDFHHRVHTRVTPDTTFLVPGHEKFSDQAQLTYVSYCTLMHGLLLCYGIQQEAEVVSGCVVRMHDHLSREIVQWSQILKQQYRQLVQTFRQEFVEQCNGCPHERYQIASAWYWAAYSDENEEQRCLSFPWILADELAAIQYNPELSNTSHRSDQARPGSLGHVNGAISYTSLAESISETLLVEFNERQPLLFSSLLEREDLCEKVERCIKASKDASVKIFGSSATFLFEPAVSDLDLCIQTGDGSHWQSLDAQVKLLKEVLPSLQQDFPGTYAIENTRVPILKYEGVIPFDLTANDHGLKKRNLILSYVIACPALLLVLSLVIRWARYVGLTAYQHRRPLTSFGLAWLFIQFCLQHGFISQLRIIEQGTNDRPSNLLAFVIEELMDPSPTQQKRFAGGQLPGEVILSFFRELSDVNLEILPGATAESPFSLPDPVEEANSSCVQMDDDFRVSFVNRCLQAWHALTRTRSVKSLFSLGERQVCLRLSRFQSSLFRGSEEYHAQRLSLKSGGKAKVRIFSRSQRLLTNRRGRAAGTILLQVEIQGDPIAVAFIERRLQELNDGNCWLPGTGRSFFVKGATFLMFEGSLSDEDLVGFRRYAGPFHLKHMHCCLHTPVLVASVGGLDWKSHAFGKLRVAVWRQRQLLHQWSLSDNSPDEILCTGTLRAVLRFGTLYTTNVPRDLEESMDSLSVSDLEEYVVRGRRHAQPWIAQRADEEFSVLEDESELDGLVQQFETQTFSTTLAKKKKSKKRQTGASMSLFPHVKVSVNHLRDYLRRDGFTKVEGSRVTYCVGVFAPKEYRIRLNDKLVFLSLSKRHVRWLSGSLLFRADGMSRQAGEQRPNCMRFYVEMHGSDVIKGDLLTKAKQNAVLVVSENGQLLVGPAFQGKAAYVRKVSKEAWTNPQVGLTVEILDVNEWEGWDQQTQKFKRENFGHQEVEVHLHDVDRSLRGSMADCEKFIYKSWEAAIKFKEFLFHS